MLCSARNVAQRLTQHNLNNLNNRSNRLCNSNNSHRYIAHRRRNSLTINNTAVSNNMVASNSMAANNNTAVNSNTVNNNTAVNSNIADPTKFSNTTKKVASARSSLSRLARCIGSAMPNSKDVAAAPNIGGLT